MCDDNMWNEENNASTYETGPTARKKFIIFFVIDVSRSMTGAKIGTVNDSIRESLDAIKEIAEEHDHAIFEYNILAFSNDAQWVFDQPVSINNASWVDLEVVDVTNMGRAFKQLNEKMTKDEFFPEGLYYSPLVILLTDGLPTDPKEVLDANLEALKKNRTFANSQVYAVSIGTEPDKEILKDFAGTAEGVITVLDTKKIKDIVVLVTITNTKLQTSPIADISGEAEQTAMRTVHEELGGDPDVIFEKPEWPDPDDSDPGIWND